MFHVVFICTGNRCRSPAAEGWLRHFAARAPLEVRSVGLLDLGEATPPRDMIEVARKIGLDLGAHRARPMTSTDLGRIDLVVGLALEHVAAAVVEAGSPVEKTFMLTEVVRLLEEIEPPETDDLEERARIAVERAHEVRSRSKSFRPGEDVADPIGGPRSGYVYMIEQVQDLCRRLTIGLFGAESLAERERDTG